MGGFNCQSVVAAAAAALLVAAAAAPLVAAPAAQLEAAPAAPRQQQHLDRSLLEELLLLSVDLICN